MMIRVFIIITCFAASLNLMEVFADNELHSDYLMRTILSENKSPAQRIDSYRQLLKVDSSMLYNPIAFKINRILLRNGLYTEADSLLAKMEKKSAEKDVDWKCKFLYASGWTALYCQNYSKAMGNALQLLQLSKPDSLLYRNSDAYILMSDLFNMMRNYTFGEKCARHASSIINKLDRQDKKHRLTQAMICLSNSLIGQDKDKDAFALLKKAREIASDSVQINAILGTLGMLYAKNGEFPIAENYYLEAAEINSDSINKRAQLLNLLSLKIADGNFKDAEAIIEGNNATFSNIGNPNMVRGLYEAKSYICEHNDNLKEALNASRLALTYADSAYAAERKIYTTQLSNQFQEQLNELEKGTKKSWTPILLISLAVALVGSTVAFLWIHVNKQKLKMTTQIEALQTELRAAKETSKNEAEVKSQRLVTMAMHLARANESLSGIEALVTDKSQDPDARLKQISAILRQLSSEDNLWEMFKTYFEQVNQSFFNNLYKIQPNLTNAEIRMSAFILMNLTSKEIAVLTNRSVRTVESIKYNLRKKLAITEPTESFMRRIASPDFTFNS